jgi:hypothetical protein
MNTLTQEQIEKIIEESYGRIGCSPTKADAAFANAAFALGVAQEREACAKVCEDDESGRDSGGYFADVIRTRK